MNQNFNQNLIKSFCKLKGNISQKVAENIVQEHTEYCSKRNFILQTMAQMRCLIDHILFIENCGVKYKSHIHGSCKIEKMWSELLALSSNLKLEKLNSKLYCIYFSPQRNIKNEYLIKSINNTGNVVNLDISNCFHIFKKSTRPNKLIISVDKDNLKNIHIDSKTCLSYNENLIQLEGDTIKVLYLDVFFFRNSKGLFLKKIYKGMNPNDFDRLIQLCKGQIYKEKFLEIQNILKTILNEMI